MFKSFATEAGAQAIADGLERGDIHIGTDKLYYMGSRTVTESHQKKDQQQVASVNK